MVLLGSNVGNGIKRAGDWDCGADASLPLGDVVLLPDGEVPRLRLASNPTPARGLRAPCRCRPDEIKGAAEGRNRGGAGAIGVTGPTGVLGKAVEADVGRELEAE